jgi:hypothetical protein
MDVYIKPVTLRVANEFVKLHHRHNTSTTGHKFSISLWNDKDMIGVAIAGRPSSRYYDDGVTLEITRVCVVDGYTNACSLLYSNMRKIGLLMGYTRIITYTLQSESQITMKALGGELLHSTRALQWDTVKRRRTTKQLAYNEKKYCWLLNPLKG